MEAFLPYSVAAPYAVIANCCVSASFFLQLLLQHQHHQVVATILHLILADRDFNA
jgi:hypothetical protein